MGNNLDFENIVKTFRDEGIYGPTSKPKLEPIMLDKPITRSNSIFKYPLEPQFVELIQKIVIETMQMSVYKTPQEKEEEFNNEIRKVKDKIVGLDIRIKELDLTIDLQNKEIEKLTKLIQEIALP
jgi:hypothetical protein